MKMAPWGHKAILRLVLFPQTLCSRWFGPGSHSLCLAAIFYATQTTQLYQSKTDGQRECSVSLKDKESVVCCWALVGFSLSDLMHINYFFFFADFPVCAFSWFSKHFNQTWVNFYYVQVQRNSCGKWHTISYCPCTITPDEWTLYLVTWGFSPSLSIWLRWKY